MFNKSIFKTAMLIFAANFLFNACTKQENENTSSSAATIVGIEQMKVENGRIAFKNSAEFFKFTTDITGKSEDELNSWEKQIGFKSLRKELLDIYLSDNEPSSELKQFEDLHFPVGHLSVLNENGECLIGDTIILYSNGIKHFVPNKDEQMLEAIRTNPSVSKFKGTAGGKVIEENTPSSLVTLDGNAFDARHQFQFTSQTYLGQTSQGPKKFVHELSSFAECNDPWCNSVSSKLSLRIKFEYRSCPRFRSCTWRPASEYRFVTYNFTCTSQFFGSFPSGLPFSNTFAQTLSFVSQPGLRVNSEISMILAQGGTLTQGPTHWDATVDGTITQIMDGDVQSNKFINSGSLW